MARGQELNVNKLSLTLGLFCALLHAVWALLVGIGIGKESIDLVLPLHFLSIVYSVTAFSFVNAIILVVLAFVGGYVCGWVFAKIWNSLKK